MFSSFNLHERLAKGLDELGWTEPTPVQQATIPPALEGRDIWAVAQTGSGKTAAFVLPMLHRLLDDVKPGTRTRALILLPTRELAVQTMEQVARFARFTFLEPCLITGGEGFREQAARMRKIPDILVATPGRALEHLEAGNLLGDEIEILVLDEVDRMLDLGLGETVQQLAAACEKRRQTLTFSATRGSGKLRTVLQPLLNNPEEVMLNEPSELSPGTRQWVITSDHAGHKLEQVKWLLANETYTRALIFTNTRVQADQLYGKLKYEGVDAYVLHGEKEHEQRLRVMEQFRQGQGKIMIATDVAARGLDIGGLDLVINFDMPHSGTEYVHRIGRTGRAGESGLSVSLISHNDWNLMCSIERYLKQSFERRNLPGLKAKYQGPKADAAKKKKQLKKRRSEGDKSNRPKSGKALKKPAKASRSPTKASRSPKPARSAGKGASAVSQDGQVQRDGFAPIRKKKPTRQDDSDQN